MTSWVGKDKILVQTSIGKRSDFYLAELRDDKVGKLRGGFLWNHNMPYGLIAAGSVIYAIGDPDYYLNRDYSEKPLDHDIDDDYHIHSGASFLDLGDPSARWKGLEKMLDCNRAYPCCATLGDNIFVFGLQARASPRFFGEFYDNKDGCWQPIPMSGINHKMRIASPLISDPKHNRLLGYFDLLKSLYAYYPYDNHRWVCLDDHMVYWKGEAAPQAVDDILFFIISDMDCDDNCITAYDILTNKCLDISWSSCSPFGPDILDDVYFKHLLCLGDNILCLTATNYAEPGFTFWEFYRFQVRRLSPQEVLLTPLSFHDLAVEGGRKSQLNTIAL